MVKMSFTDPPMVALNGVYFQYTVVAMEDQAIADLLTIAGLSTQNFLTSNTIE